MGGALLGAVVLLLLAATGLFVATSLRIRAAPDLLLTLYTVAFAEIVALALFLSAFRSLTRTSLIGGTACLFVAAAGAWILTGAARPPRIRPAALGRSGPLVVVAIAVALALTYVAALIVFTPPNGWDPMNYHLPRAAFWLEQEHVGYIKDAYDQRLNFNPPNHEITLAFVLGVTHDETLTGVAQFFAALACSVGIFAFARRLGFQVREAAFGALLFLTLPIVVLQASDLKNDLVVAACLIAAANFLWGRSRVDLALGALATALAVGTKFTAAYGVAVLLVLGFLAPAPGRVARIGAIVAGAAVGSYWYVVNLIETGRFLGDQSNTPGLTAPLHLRENLLTLYGTAVDWLDVSGAQGADILLYAIAALVVAAGTVALGGRGRRFARTAFVAIVVLSPILVLGISEHLGRPGLVRLYHALHEPEGYVPAGDSTAASPTTASDTGSWFGPAGLTLLPACGASAVALVRRRRLGPIAGIPASVVVGWFVLVGVTLTYNPWLGRFFIFPVALSAAAWGLALRSRPAAWSAVALAVITVFLSLVHYEEKPSGLRLFDRSPTASIWTMQRWDAQSLHDPPLAPLLRFVDDEIPRRDSIALALGANEFGYPMFAPHAERHVSLVPFGSSARDQPAPWLVADTQRTSEIDTSCWSIVYRSERGTVFRRQKGCVSR